MEGNKEKEQELHMIFSKERVRINGEWFLPSAKLLDYINLHNLRSNTYVDFINNKLMPLLMIHSISI
jgi:hypothetical protein